MYRIGILASAIAFAATASAAPTPAQHRSIVVEGSGQAKSMPNVATISYTLRGEGKSSDEAVRSMVAMGDRISTSLQTIDPTISPHTSDVEVSAVKSPDCKEDSDYGPKQLSTSECAVTGYVATQSVTVKTTKVSDSGTMVGLAARGGSQDAGVSDFGLQDIRAAKQRAIEDALQDAQAKAAAIARGSHLILGSILNISSVDLGSNQQVTVTAIKAPPAPAVVAVAPIRVNLAPGPITTKAHITVTYAIAN